jgi:HK97 family phage prohead protease
VSRLIVKDTVAGPPLVASASGQITALVNSTNIVDLQDDVILPGAWRRVIASGRMPKVLVGHDHDGLPVGKALRLEEWLPGDPRLPQWHREHDAGGLVMTAQINMRSQAGNDFYETVAGGYLDEWSVGMLTAKDGVRYVRDQRHVSDIDELPEVSGVLMGASPRTATLAVKAPGSRRALWLIACEREAARLVADEVDRVRMRRAVFADIEAAAGGPWTRAKAGRA